MVALRTSTAVRVPCLLREFRPGRRRSRTAHMEPLRNIGEPASASQTFRPIRPTASRPLARTERGVFSFEGLVPARQGQRDHYAASATLRKRKKATCTVFCGASRGALYGGPNERKRRAPRYIGHMCALAQVVLRRSAPRASTSCDCLKPARVFQRTHDGSWSMHRQRHDRLPAGVSHKRAAARSYPCL
jgi:hypothetical protein